MGRVEQQQVTTVLASVFPLINIFLLIHICFSFKPVLPTHGLRLPWPRSLLGRDLVPGNFAPQYLYIGTSSVIVRTNYAGGGPEVLRDIPSNEKGYH